MKKVLAMADEGDRKKDILANGVFYQREARLNPATKKGEQ